MTSQRHKHRRCLSRSPPIWRHFRFHQRSTKSTGFFSADFSWTRSTKKIRFPRFVNENLRKNSDFMISWGPPHADAIQNIKWWLKMFDRLGLGPQICQLINPSQVGGANPADWKRSIGWVWALKFPSSSARTKWTAISKATTKWRSPSPQTTKFGRETLVSKNWGKKARFLLTNILRKIIAWHFEKNPDDLPRFFRHQRIHQNTTHSRTEIIIFDDPPAMQQPRPANTTNIADPYRDLPQFEDISDFTKNR